MSVRKDLADIFSTEGTFYDVTDNRGTFLSRATIKARVAQSLAKASRMFPADSKYRLKSPADEAEKYLGDVAWMRFRRGSTVSSLCRDAVRNTFGEWAT